MVSIVALGVLVFSVSWFLILLIRGLSSTPRKEPKVGETWIIRYQHSNPWKEDIVVEVSILDVQKGWVRHQSKENMNIVEQRIDSFLFEPGGFRVYKKEEENV